MKTRHSLTALLILIFSLPFLVVFLYSVSSLCESIGCEMCGVVNHHIGKWLGFFTNVLNNENQLLLAIGLVAFLVILIVKNYFQKNFINFKLYYRHKLFKAFNSIFFNPIKQLYANAIVDSQIYS